MRDRTVAMLMAGGTAERDLGTGGLRFKALLPFHGRPLADHVLRALQASAAERVFVLQPAGSGLEAVLTPHEKNVFIDCPTENTSIATTIVTAVTAVLRRFGGDALAEHNVMWVPCDIPLVTAADFDALIEQSHQPDPDMLLAIIPSRLLRDRWPHKHFRSLRLRDRGERYSMQGIVFVDGRQYHLVDADDASGGRLVFRDSRGEPIPGVTEDMDRMRETRHGALWVLRLVFGFVVRRMVRRGVVTSLPRGVARLAAGRLTVTEIAGYLHAALAIRFGVVESRCTAFSADVDTEEDLRRLAAAAAFADAADAAGTRSVSQS